MDGALPDLSQLGNMGAGGPSQEKTPNRPKANSKDLLGSITNSVFETAKEIVNLFNPLSWGKLLFGKGKSSS